MPRRDFAKEGEKTRFSSENQPPVAAKSRKGIPNRSTVFERLLKIKIKVPNPQNKTKELTVSLHEAMALGQIQSAMKGNTRAFTEIQDSIFGRITEIREVNLGGGLSLDIQEAIAEIYGEKSDGDGGADESENEDD